MDDCHNDYAYQRANAEKVIAEQVAGNMSVLLFKERQSYHVILSSGMRQYCGRSLKYGTSTFAFWVTRLEAEAAQSATAAA